MANGRSRSKCLTQTLDNWKRCKCMRPHDGGVNVYLRTCGWLLKDVLVPCNTGRYRLIAGAASLTSYCFLRHFCCNYSLRI